jgi:hypothetical protein
VTSSVSVHLQVMSTRQPIILSSASGFAEMRRDQDIRPVLFQSNTTPDQAMLLLQHLLMELSRLLLVMTKVLMVNTQTKLDPLQTSKTKKQKLFTNSAPEHGLTLLHFLLAELSSCSEVSKGTFIILVIAHDCELHFVTVKEE